MIFITLPTEINESLLSENVEAIKLKISQDVSNSALWDEEIRKAVTSTKKTDFEINQLKSEHLVPGLCIPLYLLDFCNINSFCIIFVAFLIILSLHSLLVRKIFEFTSSLNIFQLAMYVHVHR